MKRTIRTTLRLLVVMALLLTSAVAFAQDETDTTDTAIPFVGIRFMEADNGVLVTGIISNTPAANAGLQPGDVITRVNKFAVNAFTVQETVWSYDVDETVTLIVERNGRTLTQNIRLMARPADLFENSAYALPMEPSSIGLVVADFNGELWVLGTVEGSQAHEAGFQTNDVITRIDTDTITSVADAAISMSDLTDGETVEFYLDRDAEELVISIIVDRRRRRPAPRPRDVTSIYNTDSIRLGYGEGFIQVQELGNNHELYISGLRVDDTIIGVNGDSIDSLNNLFASDGIDLTVERNGYVINFDVPTSVAPLLMFGLDAPPAQDQGEWLGLHEKQVTLGVRYIQLEADSPYFTSNSVTNGAYIAEVIPGLPAAQAGLQVGDIIISIDGLDTTLEIDLRNRIYSHRAGDTVELEILRDGEIITLDVTLRVATS